VVTAVHADWRTAPVRPAVRAALGFLEKLIRDDAVTAADAAEVLAAGVPRDALERAVEVCVAFTMIVKIADAFGFLLQDQAGYDAGAKMLLKRGYIL
jgi:hypothetical protein